MVNGSKYCSNLRAAPLPDLLIITKVVEFEKFSLSDMQDLKTVR